MTTDTRWRTLRAASDLAALLRAARRYVTTERARVCVECGHVFVDSAGRRCARCEIKQNQPLYAYEAERLVERMNLCKYSTTRHPCCLAADVLTTASGICEAWARHEPPD